MTLQGLVFKNLFHNGRRTFLTVTSIAVSLAMIVILQSFLAELLQPSAMNEAVPRVVIRHRVSLTLNLPNNYQEKILQTPGVMASTPLIWYQGIYKNEDAAMFFPRFAVDPETFFDVFIDYAPSKPEYFEAFKNERTACLIGENLMASAKLKIGDKINVTGDIFPVDLELTVRGSYKGPDSSWLMFHQKYLDELMETKVRPGSFWARAESVEKIPEVIRSLEEQFRNSDSEVKVETEKAFQMSFVEMLGNIKLLFGALISVIVFAVVLIAASTMAMAIRERTRDIAVLKTIGYEATHVLIIIMAEGLLLSILGGLLGVGGVWLLLPRPKWFLAAGAGIFVFAVIGLALLFLSLVLPDSGTEIQSMGRAMRLQRFINRFGFLASGIIGFALTSLMLVFMPDVDWIAMSGGFFPYLTVRPPTVAFGVSIAFVVGFASSIIPAWNASRVPVLDGIRNVG